jgi:hypothetical protein
MIGGGCGSLLGWWWGWERGTERSDALEILIKVADGPGVLEEIGVFGRKTG